MTLKPAASFPPYGECREPFMPLDDEAKNDLYENAWSIILISILLGYGRNFILEITNAEGCA